MFKGAWTSGTTTNPEANSGKLLKPQQQCCVVKTKSVCSSYPGEAEKFG